MKDVFVSVRGRILVNVEALNMTESVGNYVKHRRVPVMVQEEKGSAVYFVPAISGESVAHGFQKILAEEAQNKSLPVCNLCKQGIFLKSTNNNVIKDAFTLQDNQLSNALKDLERFVVQNCVVEDVGGFLYAERQQVRRQRRGRQQGSEGTGGEQSEETSEKEEVPLNVKRTSNFYVGYMIPVREALENTVIESQLHTRYALGTPFVEKREGEAGGQAIYYVELSSSVYTFSFDLDTRYIGKLTFKYTNAGTPVVDDTGRLKRVETTLDALKTFLIELPFGAKKTRFLPTAEWESLVIAISDRVWTVSSPFTANYINTTVNKRDKIDYNTKLCVYQHDSGSLEETVISAIQEAKARIES